MSEPPRPLEDWPDHLESVIDPLTSFHRVFVLRETASTQDAALRLGAAPGDVIVCWRQMAGRGRLGARWQDSEQGVAMTVILPERPEDLPSVRCAVGVVRGLTAIIGEDGAQQLRIKWPNDLFLQGRKVGGILLEAGDGVIRAGIGLNVVAIDWPAGLSQTAISLHDAGYVADRLAVISEVLRGLESALAGALPSIIKMFSELEWLRGKHAVLQSGEDLVEGLVLGVDPASCGLRIATADGGARTMPAATTRVVSFEREATDR